MNKQDTIIKKGEVILFSLGDGFDYHVEGLCRAKKEIDLKKVREKYLKQYPYQRKEYLFKLNCFIKWILIDNVLAEGIPFTECHVDDFDGEFALGKKEGGLT